VGSCQLVQSTLRRLTSKAVVTHCGVFSRTRPTWDFACDRQPQGLFGREKVGRKPPAWLQVYRTTKATLQRLLGVGSQTTARDLCIQHGCARLEQSVKAALAAYKERFVRRLPLSQQQHVDFGRPVFLATAFYLVARKNKMKVGNALEEGGYRGPVVVLATRRQGSRAHF